MKGSLHHMMKGIPHTHVDSQDTRRYMSGETVPDKRKDPEI